MQHEFVDVWFESLKRRSYHSEEKTTSTVQFKHLT